MSAAGVTACTVSFQETSPGSIPRAALHDLEVKPIPVTVAKGLIVRHHYLHSLPGGTKLSFGVLLGRRLMGAVTLGVGPYNIPSLVEGATAEDCLALTRLWLSDCLPKNCESRVLGIILRSLRGRTNVRFLVSYADPSQGHVGGIYQATNWLYTGLSEVMPLYDLGDGQLRHSRSLSHAFGSHSIRHFARNNVQVKLVAQSPKHRYGYFLDPSWSARLRVPVLPYPKREVPVEAG